MLTGVRVVTGVVVLIEIQKKILLSRFLLCTNTKRSLLGLKTVILAGFRTVVTIQPWFGVILQPLLRMDNN